MTGSQFFPNGFSGRHMLLFLSVFFGMMFLVNGIFLYYAVTTFNGLSTDDAYRKGLHYNERIGEGVAQSKLGWTSSIKVDPKLEFLTLKLADKNGAPLRGAQLDAELSRPASDRFDITLKMVERAPGTYVTVLNAGREDGVALGNWVFKLNVYEAGNEAAEGAAKIIYRMKNRIWLTQPK